jgi:hypothetical protein
VAIGAAIALAAIEARRLVTLIGWERSYPYARDFLPAAIATAVMTLAAYLLILELILTRRNRKWGLALGIAWGAIAAGTSLWIWLGPYAKNLWHLLAYRLGLSKTLVHYGIVGWSSIHAAIWLVVLASVLVLSAAKAFIDSPRERLDRGIVLASLFYAAFYFLAIGIVARFVTPR